MEHWRLKIESWRAFRPVVADSHHFDMDQDPDPHLSEKSWIWIRIKVKNWIRVRIRLKVLRTRYPGYNLIMTTITQNGLQHIKN